MIIIKHGDKERLNKTKLFYCKECGCEFKATKDEYKYDGAQYNMFYYKCKCPCCGNIVYSES